MNSTVVRRFLLAATSMVLALMLCACAHMSSADGAKLVGWSIRLDRLEVAYPMPEFSNGGMGTAGATKDWQQLAPHLAHVTPSVFAEHGVIATVDEDGKPAATGGPRFRFTVGIGTVYYVARAGRNESVTLQLFDRQRGQLVWQGSAMMAGVIGDFDEAVAAKFVDSVVQALAQDGLLADATHPAVVDDL